MCGIMMLLHRLHLYFKHKEIMNTFACLSMHLLSVDTIKQFMYLHVLCVSLYPVSARLCCLVCVFCCAVMFGCVLSCVCVCFV